MNGPGDQLATTSLLIDSKPKQADNLRKKKPGPMGRANGIIMNCVSGIRSISQAENAVKFNFWKTILNHMQRRVLSMPDNFPDIDRIGDAFGIEEQEF